MSGNRPANQYRIAFVSSNSAWGGSEELWSEAAAIFAKSGSSVFVYKPWIDELPSKAGHLRRTGCRTIDLHGPAWIPRKARVATSLIWKASRPLQESQLRRGLRRQRPSLVVISQGLNHDGCYLAKACRREKVPYVIISQKASDFYWPRDDVREEIGAAYRGASAVLFVSEHNRALTEQQIGFTIANARVVRNPFKTPFEPGAAWPGESRGWRLACVARLDVREKGQDLLFRVLAMQKWRDRPLTVTLFGSGHNEMGLRAMARMLELDNVGFAGFVEDAGAIWHSVHGLVLPSRCEGLPLSIIEAMLSGRIVIATDVGGTREAVVDGVTGFLAKTATESDLDSALERAWERRADWRSIGAAAAEHARTIVEPLPADTLVASLIDLMAAAPNDRGGASADARG